MNTTLEGRPVGLVISFRDECPSRNGCTENYNARNRMTRGKNIRTKILKYVNIMND